MLLTYVGSVASVTCWIPRVAWLMGQLSHQAAQTPASHWLVSKPGARWSGSLENMRTDVSRAICIHAAFPGLIRICESSSLCSPDGPWPVPPLKGTAVTGQIVPYCQQLSGYPGSVFCFRITSVPMLLKEDSAEFLFFYWHICISGCLSSFRIRFPSLQKSFFPKPPQLLRKEKKKETPTLPANFNGD